MHGYASDVSTGQLVVCEQAAGGEVLVSGAVPPLVAGSGIRFEPHGTHELRGIEGEWKLFRVAG